MFRAIRLESGAVKTGGREVCDAGATLWIDCTPDPEHLAWLGERFGFHPLALEDCANEDQRTKLELYDDAAFVVFHRLGPAPDETGIQSRELHAFLTTDALVTVHSAPIVEVDRVFERAAARPNALSRGPDHALYLVADAITDIHFAVVDALAEDVEELLSEVTTVSARDEPELLERILDTRRRHAILRRRLSPQRELFLGLMRQGEDWVRAGNAPYYRDVLDHLQRLTDEIDNGRDLLGSAMDVHFSIANNRLSGTTTRLTLVATIFLPLNFVAGFFGMNLEILPPVVAIPLVLGIMVALPLVLWRLFRRKGLL